MRSSASTFALPAALLLASLALSQSGIAQATGAGLVGEVLGLANGLASSLTHGGAGAGSGAGAAAAAAGAAASELGSAGGPLGLVGSAVNGMAKTLSAPVMGTVGTLLGNVGAAGSQLMGQAAAGQVAARMGAASAFGGYTGPYGPVSPFANYNARKHEAALAGGLAAERAVSAGAAAGTAAALGATEAVGSLASGVHHALSMAGPAMVAETAGNLASAATHGAAAATAAGAAAAAGAAGAIAGEVASSFPAATGALAGPAAAAAAAAPLLAAGPLAPGRQVLAAEALSNAQAESAIAGADMIAHGANNARSASLAGNAYRQAKLATARDRVNIAGTIQNSARISDAAIATHDAATKAEDSLLGSELAVDSAATVLDSDAAYIPPVTNSLLRSLPYGRLGIRNILPKPLTYPSVLLPDVWMNGMPVNYFNMPLRGLPYGISPVNTLLGSSVGLAAGQIINGQPFVATNGPLLNGMFFDPTLAYMAHLNAGGILTSSIFPVLANGQLEAHDELALANAVALSQQYGPGMGGTYNAFGRRNPVPMITGTVSDGNLQPTTTIGTTYPIGSALVIQPRDSYFQDYIDNASSRQNFDERHQ